jgi:hypothetical protein
LAEAAVWASLAGCAQADWAGLEAGRWNALAELAALRWRILTGPDPVRRIDPDPARRPGQPRPAPDRATCLDQAETALAQAEQTEQARAEAASGAEAAWWAGLAAAAAQARHGLTGPWCEVGPIQPLAALAVQDEPTALAALIEAYHQTVFAAGAALGLVGPNDSLSQPLRTILEQARRQRDDLIELARAQRWPAPAGAPAYDLPPDGDPASASALVGSAQAGLASAAAQWVQASQERRPRAVLALIEAAVLTLPLGQGCAAWPGWPD